MTLDKLALGQRAKVKAVRGKGALRRRLLAMGFTPGAEVTPRKTAPLGDPLELCLRGYEIAIRMEDAACIEIMTDGRKGRKDEKNPCMGVGG